MFYAPTTTIVNGNTSFHYKSDGKTLLAMTLKKQIVLTRPTLLYVCVCVGGGGGRWVISLTKWGLIALADPTAVISLTKWGLIALADPTAVCNLRFILLFSN